MAYPLGSSPMRLTTLPTNSKPMTYMQDLEQKLRTWLESFAAGDISSDAFIAMLKKSHLESYYNGQSAGPRQTPQQGTGQTAPSAAPRWGNKKPSAGGAQFNRGNYQR